MAFTGGGSREPDTLTAQAYAGFDGIGADAQTQAPTIAAGTQRAGSMRYGLLRQMHPADLPHDRGYDAKVWRELDDLYRGGYQIAAHAAEYLPKVINETDGRWAERCTTAAYIGYFGRIVEAYVGAIFENSVAVVPAGDADDASTPGELPDREVYDEFGSNTDLCGAGFAQVLRKITATALVKGKALLCADFPSVGVEPKSRAESDALGVARPYAYCMEPESLIDWEYESELQRRVKIDDERDLEFTVGRFAWCITKKTTVRRANPEDQRGAAVEEYRVWRKLPDGRVIWQVYRTPPMKDGRLDDKIEVPLIDEQVTTFTEIPIVEFKLPDTLWLGNVVGPLNKEHWQRRSQLLYAQMRSLLVIPTIYLGPETPGFQQAIMADVQQDPARGEDPAGIYRAQGYLTLGKDDELAFEGPAIGPFEIVADQLDKLVDEIYRVAGNMASGISSSSTALGRSGASKAFDHDDFTTVVSAIAAVISDGARRTYTIISDARREDVVWTVHGLSGYEAVEDRALLITEATGVGALGIPSKTFLREYRLELAKKLLPGRDVATMTTIQDEIRAASEVEEKEPPSVPKPPIVSGQPAEDMPPSGSALLTQSKGSS